MNEKILVPVDGSEHSIRALDAAADLARTLGATLIVCQIVDLTKAVEIAFGQPQFVEGCIAALRADCESNVKQAVERVTPGLSAVESRIGTGNVVEEILKLASETDAKWIVMGSHGRSGLSRMLMGSVAEGVVRHANVPVMIVPPKRHDRTHEAPPLAAAAPISF